MNSDDEHQPQVQVQVQTCKNCPAPVAKGYIGMRTHMCLPCTRVSLGIAELDPQTSSSQEKASDTNELESSLGYQSGAEIYLHNHAGSFSTEDEKIVQSSRSHKRLVRPIAIFPEDRVKLTPACAKCKRAKIRCMHRRALGEEDNNISFDGSTGDSQAAPSMTGKKVRLRLNPEVEGKAEPESNPSASKRHTRGTNRKRSRMEETTQDDSQDTNALSVEEIGGGDGTRDSSRRQQQQHHPQKRSRRGRKPKTERVVDDTEESSDTIPAPTYESTRPTFGANSLEGAGLLSRHVVLSRELQQKLQDCDTKWLAAIESLHEAKRTLDSWVSGWQSGL